MPKKRSQLEEIIGRLHHADVWLGQNKKIAEVVKALGVTDYRWRQERGGMTTANAWPLKHVAQAASGESAL